MNISDYFSQYLTVNGSLSIPNFGIFKLENVHAEVDINTEKILPPAKKVTFQDDYLLQDLTSLKEIASTNSVDFDQLLNEVNKQSTYWKQKLSAGEEFEIKGLGDFVFNEGPQFRGKRIAIHNPDYYGLEEIALSDIRTSNVQNSGVEAAGNDSNESYKLNRSVLWLFLFIIPLAGLLFLAFNQKDRIFGKKSFDDLTVKNSTHRIQPAPVVAIDSAAIKLADSLKQDSLKKATVVPVAKKTYPKKKYSSTKKRKYSTKKWSKARKRVNR